MLSHCHAKYAFVETPQHHSNQFPAFYVTAPTNYPQHFCVNSQDKFRLDYDDEAAVVYMQQLINESATALMPQIVETTHRWAQYWR